MHLVFLLVVSLFLLVFSWPFCAVPFCSTAAIFVEFFDALHTLPNAAKLVQDGAVLFQFWYYFRQGFYMV